MKILSIVVAFTLCEAVKGWLAMLQPIALSIGAAFVALSSDVDLVTDLQPIAWKKWLSTKEENKVSEKEGAKEKQKVLSVEELKELKDKLLNDLEEPLMEDK